MGGDIVVTPRRGGGTTFTLECRADAGEGAGRPRLGADGEHLMGAARALHLLSVEDNPFGRVVLNAILTELGHQTEFIGQGEAAQERIAQGGRTAREVAFPGPRKLAGRGACAGAQVCAADGARFGACDCGPGAPATEVRAADSRPGPRRARRRRLRAPRPNENDTGPSPASFARNGRHATKRASYVPPPSGKTRRFPRAWANG